MTLEKAAARKINPIFNTSILSAGDTFIIQFWVTEKLLPKYLTYKLIGRKFFA